MSDSAFFFFSNLLFTVLNCYYALYGAFPRFSALCTGICGGATIFTLYNWVTYG